MGLLEYFEVDDGSLPEITVTFPSPAHVVRAFAHLFACGAANVTADGGLLWLTASESEAPFGGADDAALVTSGAAEPFHVVLAGVTCSGASIPDLGVFVDPDRLTLDYQMGSAWGEPEIQALLGLLRQLRELDGVVTVPWWGPNGERDFLLALGGA